MVYKPCSCVLQLPHLGFNGFAFLAEARIQCLSRIHLPSPSSPGEITYGKVKCSVPHECVAAGPHISKHQRTRDGSKVTSLLSKHTHSPLPTATKYTPAASKSGRCVCVGGPEVILLFPFSVHLVSMQSPCILQPRPGLQRAAGRHLWVTPIMLAVR